MMGSRQKLEKDYKVSKRCVNLFLVAPRNTGRQNSFTNNQKPMRACCALYSPHKKPLNPEKVFISNPAIFFWGINLEKKNGKVLVDHKTGESIFTIGMFELFQCLGLYLPNALSGNRKIFTNLFKG